MSKTSYPKNLPARYKATFRSLISELKSTIKFNKREKGDDKTLAHNIACIVVWRIQVRDKKVKQTIDSLRRAIRNFV